MRKSRHKKVQKISVLSFRITPDLGKLERQNLYQTMPWISLHPKINLVRSQRASFTLQMTRRWGYSERSSKATPMGFLYTELSEKQRQSKDGQITLIKVLDCHMFYTIGKPVSRVPSSVSFVELRIS